MDEKQKQNYLSMWNGRRGAERATAYQPRDDGNHYYNQKDYYEWWYIDASFNNGYHFVATFHYMNSFMRPHIPTIQAMIYKPDGTSVARFDLCDKNTVYASPDYCDVRMGESWLRDTGGTYELFVKVKGVGARLTLKPKVPGWKPGTGLLYHDADKGAVAGWCVAVPYAEASGELYLKEGAIPVKGDAYHDHNWGNVPQIDLFQSWYWGRIHNNSCIIDYGWVLPRDKDAPIVSPLLIARSGEIVLSTDRMETKLDDFVRDEKSGKEYAKKLIITADDLGVRMSLTIATTSVIESLTLPKIAEWDSYYYRFLADYKMCINVDGVEEVVRGMMLHELMFL